MIKRIFKIVCIFSLLFIGGTEIYAQKILEKQIGDSLNVFANRIADVGRVYVNSIAVDQASNTMVIRASSRLATLPMRPDNVQQIYDLLRSLLGNKYDNFHLVCESDNRAIEDLIPNNFRVTDIDSLRIFKIQQNSPALVRNLSRKYAINQGLDGRHIAVWQSHGRYFNQEKSKWLWQRARLFQTVEDLYTQSYVLSYLTPMLENAGANVLIPRERDTQLHEIIVDNDKSISNSSHYKRVNNRYEWAADTLGFAHLKHAYTDTDNPFRLGSYEYVRTTMDAEEVSKVEWVPFIPEKGHYAVYISYKSLINSTQDARYTVYHAGGKTEFSVNQTMSGGTWVYLGMFSFPKGKNRNFRVELSNFSSADDNIVTADAVKIGGGMGNIARRSKSHDINAALSSDSKAKVQPTDTISPQISNYPRFTEGARYWLQWAGLPDSIYSRTVGVNDYTDDFQSRGFWMKHLIGGSVLAPERLGFAVPVDLALAFHSDAGNTKNDNIVGTLGIYSGVNTLKESMFENGVSRMASRDLSDMLQTQIVNDIRRIYEPNWTIRGLWDKSYSESREPEVPTMLLELLSHQNLADMRYGLDPRFRFDVSRAIYKAMLKYIAYNNNQEYTVQPLPVDRFSSRFISNDIVELRWMPVVDSLESTAKADRYIVYTRIDDAGFDHGMVVDTNVVILPVLSGKIYSYKIAALNDGGESFPSEILSVYRAKKSRGEVLIINGFERISGPGFFKMNNTVAGVNDEVDPGVPYLADISYTGKQYEYQVDKDWKSDDDPGFGASAGAYETHVIAGNRFDYPFVHGKAIKEAGFSFVSTSVQSVIRSEINLQKYRYIDIILGKQKQTKLGISKINSDFKTFPLALQKSLRKYCESGGNLMLSGAFIVSDFLSNADYNIEEKKFVEEVLKIDFNSIVTVPFPKIELIRNAGVDFEHAAIPLYTQPNNQEYFIESGVAFRKVMDAAFPICRYQDSTFNAAVAFAGQYNIVTFGFPFEVIKSEKDRNETMKSVLDFFSTSNELEENATESSSKANEKPNKLIRFIKKIFKLK
jgi:hypothetical protein